MTLTHRLLPAWPCRWLCAALPMLALSPTLQADEFSSLKGYWQCQEAGGGFSLEFESAQQLIYNGQAARYQLVPNAFIVEEEGGPTGYYYQLQGGVLTILSPDGTLSQCQKGSKPAAPYPPKQATIQTPTRAGQTLVPGQNWPVYARPAGRVTMESTDPQALLYKFAGRWDHVTANTLTNLYLKPDGSYEDAYEAGYSGTFEDQGGYQTGNWGATGTEQGGGYWTIQGNLIKGVITLVGHNGRRREINYQVYMKNGEYYGDYYFNGKLHTVKYIYR